MEQRSLRGRTLFITGASRGIRENTGETLVLLSYVRGGSEVTGTQESHKK